MSDLGQATLLRMVWSRRQLFEVMVEFWSNHLNITNPSSDVWDSRHDYDRNVIRKYALGKFSDMLWASATHPAMMRYLNNADSVPPDFNENYGRELLELHTVGVDAGYTEVDMRSSALIMSGFGDPRPVAAGRRTRASSSTTRRTTTSARSRSWASRRPNATQAGGKAVAQAYVVVPGAPPRDGAAHRGQAGDPVRLRRPDADAGGQARDHVPRQRHRDRAGAASSCSPAWSSAPTRAPRSSGRWRTWSRRAARWASRPDPGNGTDGLQALWWESDSLGHMPLAWPMPNGYSDVAVDWQSTNQTLERWNLHMALGRPVVARRQRRPEQPGQHPDAAGAGAVDAAAQPAAGDVRPVRRRDGAAAGLPEDGAGRPATRSAPSWARRPRRR